jgi:hypothetical protein
VGLTVTYVTYSPYYFNTSSSKLLLRSGSVNRGHGWIGQRFPKPHLGLPPRAS